MEMTNPRMKIPILSQILAAMFRRFTLAVLVFQHSMFTHGPGPVFTTDISAVTKVVTIRMSLFS